MRLLRFILNGKYQAIFIITAIVLLAFLLAKTCSLFFDVHQLETNTDLISSVYQVMGTIYAILLTFTLWGVWQNFSEANKSVQSEAYALLDLIHTVEASTTFKNTHIREAALTYLKIVIDQEWSSLKNLTNAIINIHETRRSSAAPIIQAVQSITLNNERDSVLFEQALALLNTWLDARRTRLLIARGNSAKALWPLLFTGAFVLFAFHGLFIAKTEAIWAMLLFGTSLVIGVTFYLIYTLDHPFDGALSIDSEPFTLALIILKSEEYRQI